MKIVKLKGGLGNQMFQYAFAKLLERHTKEEVKLDFSSYQSLKQDNVRVPRITKFNISLQAASVDEINKCCVLRHTGNSLSFRYKVGIFVEKTINKNYFFELNRSYIDCKTVLSKKYYDGYWQSYKYINAVADIIENEFVPNYSLSDKSRKMISKLQTEESVFIGVRRGDYTNSQSAIKHFGGFSAEYYLNAMDVISKKVKNPVFYVFSNDIEWCKENLDWSSYNVVYREPESQTNDFEELMIMSACKHAIIVNSTYHWWGAYLIKNVDKIVCCPEKWFFDDAPIEILPPTWTRVRI